MSLVFATSLITTTWERSKYLNVSRQVFFDNIQVEKTIGSGGTITFIRKDLKNFQEALQNWDYHSLKHKMNILLIVKQPSLKPQAYLEENGHLLDTIDGTYLQTTNSTIRPTNCQKSNGDNNLEVYVILTNRNMRITLDTIWTKRLFYNTENLIAVNNDKALTKDFRQARDYKQYSNLHENISCLSLSAIKMTPLSHNIYWGAGSILRAQGIVRILIKERQTQCKLKVADLLFF